MTNIYDSWDKKIFSLIEFDYRVSHREIAKHIRRSKSFVTYRITKLEERGIINYQPLIDYSRIGYQYYRIIIETMLSRDELQERLHDMNLKMIWLVERYNTENIVLTVLAKGIKEFHSIWESLYEKLSSDVITKDIYLVFCVHHLPLTFFHNKAGMRISYQTGNADPIECTAHETLLLDLLVKKPFISMRALETETGLNQATLRRTITDLRQKNILLAYQTLLNKDLLGIRHHKIFLEFKFSKASKRRLIELLKTYPHVVYITESGFKHDLEFETLTFTDKDLQDTIKKLKEDFAVKRIILHQTVFEGKLF